MAHFGDMKTTLMTYPEACRRLDAAGLLPIDGELSPIMLLATLEAAASVGAEPPECPAIRYVIIQHVRYLADYYERNLIRRLKYKDKMTWEKVAAAVSVLTTRQAAQQKWKRLIADDRRTTTGQMQHGGRRKQMQ